MVDERATARDQCLEEILKSMRLLIRWSRKHSYMLARELHQGLDLTALSILSALKESPGSRLTDLAESLKLDLSNASRQSSLLESAGLIERTADPNDRRATLLVITPLGGGLLDRAQRDSREFMYKVYDDWDLEELVRFSGMLDRTVKSIERLHTLP